VIDILQRIINEAESEIAFFDTPPDSNTISPAPDYLFIWDKCGFIKVALNDILFLEASRSYCQIHLAGGKSILVSIPMSEVLKYLPGKDFIRIIIIISILIR
jgi:DNA-binding LytR/AlgR family response regulator